MGRGPALRPPPEPGQPSLSLCQARHFWAAELLVGRSRKTGTDSLWKAGEEGRGKSSSPQSPPHPRRVRAASRCGIQQAQDKSTRTTQRQAGGSHAVLCWIHPFLSRMTLQAQSLLPPGLQILR